MWPRLTYVASGTRQPVSPKWVRPKSDDDRTWTATPIDAHRSLMTNHSPPRRWLHYLQFLSVAARSARTGRCMYTVPVRCSPVPNWLTTIQRTVIDFVVLDYRGWMEWMRVNVTVTIERRRSVSADGDAFCVVSSAVAALNAFSPVCG